MQVTGTTKLYTATVVSTFYFWWDATVNSLVQFDPVKNGCRPTDLGAVKFRVVPSVYSTITSVYSIICCWCQS